MASPATHAAPAPLKLSSLAAWSEDHIRAIFEARTDAEADAAIIRTFASHVVATLNGAPITRAHIVGLVRSMRAGATRGGLRVHWRESVEVPRDARSSRVSHFSIGLFIQEFF